MNKTAISILLFAIILSTTVSAASSAPQPIVDCTSIFSSGPQNPYLPVLSGITGYGHIVSVALLVVLMMLLVLGVAYALGFAFHIDALMNFSRTEMLEAFGNILIIAAVGTGMHLVPAAIHFFTGLAALNTGSSTASTSSTSAFYINLCSNFQDNMIIAGLENWVGIFLNLYITNFFATGSPPNGGLTIHLMPNSFGIAFVPFQGMSLVTTLLWDAQLTYFGSMFMGMFLIILLFIIYFLFPIFLYVGIALRSFPWTRPAGGSFIALFIAFYIVFPALIYPFSVVGPASDPAMGKGFCSQNFNSASGTSQPSQLPQSMQILCDGSSSFLTNSWSKYLNLITFNFGDLYYDDVYSFVIGVEFTGINMVGLIIAMLISYEMVEKLGNILGAPSVQGSRALGRLL